ncbi:MAG: tetratricopeptide repeat protein [Acidobacteriota bacterium]
MVRPLDRRHRCWFRFLLCAVHAVLWSAWPPFPSTCDSLDVLREVQQLIQENKLDRAETQLTAYLGKYPKEPVAHSFLGVIQAQQGKMEAAEASFKEAILYGPRMAGPYLNLGRLYLENASRFPDAQQKALTVYDQLLQFQPDQVEAAYQTAVLLQHLGQFSKSQSRLARLPSAEQNRAQALAVQLANRVKMNDTRQSHELAARLVSSPDLVEPDVLSVLPFLDSHPALRVQLLEGLARRGLAGPLSWHQLGLAYEAENQWKEARQALERAAQGSPRLAVLLLDLARVAHKQGDLTGALGYLAHARDLKPGDPGIHFFFGMVCVEQNLPLEARKSLEQAVKLDDGNPYYHYALGAVLLQDRDPSLAIPQFERFCQLLPDDIRGRFSLGVAYFYSSQYEPARKQLEAVAADPRTAAAAQYFLARVAKQAGNLDEATARLRSSLAANPDYAEAHAEMGLMHIRNKEYAEAEKSLRRALELDPESYLANMNLLNLYQRTKDPRMAEQTQRFEEIKKKRSEEQQALLRTIEVRPY